MKSIGVSKAAETKEFERQKVDGEMMSFFGDSVRAAPGEIPKDRSAPDSVFNVQAALDRVEGNRQLLPTMVGLFAMQWRERLAEIAKAASRRDGAVLELVANRLKLSLGSVGAGQAKRVAEELEELGGNRSFHDLEKSHARLGIEIERLVIALKEFSNEAIVGGSLAD